MRNAECGIDRPTVGAEGGRPGSNSPCNSAFRTPHSALVEMKRKQRRAQRETSAGGVVFRRGPDGEPRFLLIRDSYRNWGVPKGHLEPGEPPAAAARREVAEETGLKDLVLHGPIRVIDWYFPFRGKTIHKFCHFFLFESRQGEPVPQLEEGITDSVGEPLHPALQTISYDNPPGALRRAAERPASPAQAEPGGRPKGD